MQSLQSNKPSYVFSSADTIKKSNIITTVNNDNNFAVFGFNQEINVISQSIINVSLDFETYKSALICFQCDIQVASSVLVFIASGQILSALMFNGQSTIQLFNVSVQYRFNCVYSAGLLINITQPLTDFQLTNVNMMGHNFMKGGNVYQLVLEVNAPTEISIEQVKSCSESSKIQADSLYVLQLSFSINFDCTDICTSNENFVYGICASVLQNGQLMTNNQTIMCVDPFVFNGELCVCKNDFVLNGSVCVNLVKSLTNIIGTIQICSNIEAETGVLLQQINNINQSLNEEIYTANKTIQQLKNQSEQYIKFEIERLENILIQNDQKAEQYILENITFLNDELNRNSSRLLQIINGSTYYLNNSISQFNTQLINQISVLNQSLILSNANLQNNISQSKIDLQSLYNQAQSNLQVQSTSLNQRLSNNITEKNNQIADLTAQIALLKNMIYYTTEYELQFKCVDELYTFKIYDAPTATQTLKASDFDTGFAFTNYNINNAFIDIQSVNTAFTLFQTQTQFLNVKIQIRDCNLQTGSLLLASTSLQINQVCFVSLLGTSITISSSSVVNILMQKSVNATITNMLLNINCNIISIGGLTLFQTVCGQLNITGYEIRGNYSSSNIITLVAYVIQANSTISLNYISITPEQFVCGNISSYLIGYIDSSIIKIQHILIQVGNIDSNNIISQISTTFDNYLTFGGLISFSNTTIANIYDIQVTSYEQWLQLFVNNTGLLIGTTNNSNISLMNACLYYQQTAEQNSQFLKYGIMGQIHGNLNVSSLSVNYYLQQSIFSIVGVIGYVDGVSLNFINSQIQFQMISNDFGDYIGVLLGIVNSNNQNIINTTINNSSIVSQSIIGLVSAYSRNTCNIKQIQITSSKASSICQLIAGSKTGTFAGGMLGQIFGQITITQCSIYNISISSLSINEWAVSSGLIGDSHNSPVVLQQTVVKLIIVDASGPTNNSVGSSATIAFSYDSTIQIDNLQLININISVQSNTTNTYSGAILAVNKDQQHNTTILLSVNNTKLIDIQIKCVSAQTAYYGIIFGVDGTGVKYISISNVVSLGLNKVNDITITNCGNILVQSVTGC
ncbi:Hypothetical_protein [Hexamita inflata]|uniref:Hypothetical_protein n=1 Tax=Hexamita inflata TaxID=28002 RepID=A0AA86TUJ3_9EUKA|nr:Hypothetical protein HINF_LOCUS16950 [Hexamita inflata]